VQDGLRNEVILEKVKEDLPENIKSFSMTNQLIMVQVSDYNENMRLQGKLDTSTDSGYTVALIVPDQMVKNFRPFRTLLCFNCKNDSLLCRISLLTTCMRFMNFKQIAIYFTLPLALACVHSVVGIKVANDVVSTFGSLNVTANVIVTVVLILVVYGAYFLATYFGSKSIVLKNERYLSSF
jgi:hypothetical protein